MTLSRFLLSLVFSNLLLSSLATAAEDPVPKNAHPASIALSEPDQDKVDQEDLPPPYLPQSGSDLVRLIEACEDDECMSYVAGVLGGVTVYAMLAEKPSPICTRGEVDTADIREAIVTTIRSTPALAETHPVIGILTAFGRYWPCLTQEEIEDLQHSALAPIDPSKVEALLASGNHALQLGNSDAGRNRTLILFHDPNCSHCMRFRGEADALVERGWKVLVYPVATSSEESEGYGAVEIALRDISPETVTALYRTGAGDSPADITLAMKIAEREGLEARDVLKAVARADAYDAIAENTRFFFETGAKGTPAWIIGASLYSGYLGADAIEKIASGFENEAAETEAAILPMEQ